MLIELECLPTLGLETPLVGTLFIYLFIGSMPSEPHVGPKLTTLNKTT